MLRTKENTKSATVSGQVPPQFRGTVIQRIKQVDFGPSKSSGKPMITLTTEIVKPLEVVSDFDGKTYSLDGVDLKYYLVLSDTNNKGEPSDSLDYIINTLMPLLGLPGSIDDEAPDTKQFEGICFEAIISSNQRKEMKKNPNGSYTPMLDADGKEIVRGWEWQNQVKDILRRAETVEGGSF